MWMNSSALDLLVHIDLPVRDMSDAARESRDDIAGIYVHSTSSTVQQTVDSQWKHIVMTPRVSECKPFSTHALQIYVCTHETK